MLADEDNAISDIGGNAELGTTSISAMSSKNIWDAPQGIPFKNFIKKVKYRTNPRCVRYFCCLFGNSGIIFYAFY